MIKLVFHSILLRRVHEVDGSMIFSPGGGGGGGGDGGLEIKLTEVGGLIMVGCDVKKIFEIISCKRAKKHLPW